MSLKLKIEKSTGNFHLKVDVNTKSRRIGILGASGSGKSMTLKCIAGIEKVDQGEIICDGRILLNQKTNLKPQKRKVGYLFQNYALFPTMTVAQNIAAGLHGKRQEKEKIIRKMIIRFQLEGLEEHLPSQLSGGQQQRVALARILAYEPDVILLDEPFSALDEFSKERLQQEMEEMLKDYKGTIVLVSHSRDEIYRFSEELIIIDQGQMICQGRTREIFANPIWKEAARLTGCKNIVKAERIDAHQLEIPDWKLTLSLKKEIPEYIHYIGVRAHDFLPLWKNTSRENVLPITAYTMAQLPFEQRYYLKSPEIGEEICWFIQKEQCRQIEEKGMPSYLAIPEEKILLLQ